MGFIYVHVSLGALNLAASELSPFNAMKSCGRGQISAIDKRSTVTLRSGQKIQLALILEPALANHAKSDLSAYLQRYIGQNITLKCDGKRQNRDGSLVAQIFTENGAWVQAGIITRGLAFVFADSAHKTAMTALQQLESEARQNRRGLWVGQYYEDIAHDDLPADNNFMIIQGRVTNVTDRKKQVYINFGDDWNRDFTVQILAPHKKRFTNQIHEGRALSIKALQGELVEVRGYITWRGGPFMTLSRPENIRVLKYNVTAK